MYLNNKKGQHSYVKKTELPNFVDENSKIITNSNNVVDFLKSNNIVSVQMNASGIAELNHFKCVNDEFDMGEIKPIYIREPQVNLKRR
ncbi:hypothetical protein FACS1894152_4760 [Bacilli bacterium]|nr:hypothetical protein FACS1894152_4760 [Bacilli bacterium]